MNKTKVNIGLDIGVASVGWSIIDENENIIDMGVRLFKDVASPEDGTLGNEKRRSARGLRRRLNRTRVRKSELKKFLTATKFIKDENEFEKLVECIDITKFGVQNPIELKVKALNQKISHDELIYILFHYIHHRGYFYKDEKQLENENNNNNSLNLYPSEKLLDFYKKNGYYKGSTESSNFSAKEYEQEIRKIFDVQNINDQSFIDGYLNIFYHVRDYAIGPGSQKSPTPYGMWYLKDGILTRREGNSLWESLIGKCTYYPNEKRGGKHSPIAEVFNFLNDISNIYFFKSSDQKLSNDIILSIFEKYTDEWLKGKTYNLTPKNLLKLCTNEYPNLVEGNINGYREDKNKKPIITELSNYKLIINWMLNVGEIKKINNNIFDFELINKANDFFVKYLLAYPKDAQARLDNLNKDYPKSLEDNKLLCVKIEGLSKTHSLSYKAMNEYISYSLNNLDKLVNQMIYFNNYLKDKNSIIRQNSKYIPHNIFDDAIISPTARRSFNQTINVINKILKLYSKNYDFNSIIIEMPRAKNSFKEKQLIKKAQKENEELLKKICDNNRLDINELKSKQKLRLKLWYQQDYKDIYDNNLILVNDVLSGTSLDIDHIIPYSISGDDSINNIVLTKSYINREKSNLTPYQYLSRNGKFEQFKNNLDKISNLPIKKKDTLTYMGDPFQDQLSFIGRNLADTAYASRLVLNTLQSFFENHELYKNLKVKVIRGQLTNYARYNLFVNDQNFSLIPKDRRIYCHHAIDASIVCWLGTNYKTKLLLDYLSSITRDAQINHDKYEFNSDNGTIINHKTGEVINVYDMLSKDNNVINFGKELAKYNSWYDDNDQNKCIIFGQKSKNVKYSRMYVTKNNIQLSNETIYSFKWKNNNDKTEGNIITNLKLIPLGQGDNPKNINQSLINYFKEDKIDQKKLENLICYKEDYTLYDQLKTIYNQYYSENTNPFIEFMKQTYNIDNPKWIQIRNRKIKKLRLIGKSKNISNIIVLDKHKSNAIQEKLNPIEVRIYKNDEGKYLTIPINQKVLSYDSKTSKLKIDDQKINELLKTQNITNKKYITIREGTIFINKSNGLIAYSNGGGNFNNNQLELKSLYCDNELCDIANGRNRAIISLSTIMNDYLIAEVDELGNIYNKKEIML